MRSTVTQGLQVLRRVRDFLAVTEVKPALGVIAKHVQELDAVIGRLSSHAVEQDASDRAFRSQASAARSQMRRLRRVYLRPVARMGSALFPNDPELRQALAMPAARSYEPLIAAGQAVAERAAEHRDRFVAAGFGEDFVDQLKQAALDLRKAIDAKAAHFGHRSAATSGMVLQLARGRNLVRLLDALVAPWLEENMPDRVAEWHTLTRFVRVAPPSETPVTPVPAPATPEAHAA